MANQTYVVKKGDTLSQIAVTYNTTVSNLVKLNNITDPDYIVVGQVLIISGEPANTTSSASKVTMKCFGLQADTDRTVYATWTWNKEHTKEYRCLWYYRTGNGVWLHGPDNRTVWKQDTYTAPSDATAVALEVKPYSTTHKVNNKDTTYWTASWSTMVHYYFKNNPPSTPPVPTVEIELYTLSAEVNNVQDLNATHIQFQIIRDDAKTYKTVNVEIEKGTAAFTNGIYVGSEYKVRCRAYRGSSYSDWSEYSENHGTAPYHSEGWYKLKALSETSVYADWWNTKYTDSYTVEYTTEKRYFDSGGSMVQSVSVDAVVGHAEITGLESGKEYFFRVKSVNEYGESGWGPIKSIKIGKAPAAPTTWSSGTTVITGDPLKLYWVHNSEDGSSQTQAQLELIIDGVKTTKTIDNTASEEDKDKTSVYSIATKSYKEGTKIKWRVRTRGILATYGDWSTQRTVDVYAPPSVSVDMSDSDGVLANTMRKFPLTVTAEAGPDTQKAIGYHISIIAQSSYETVDDIGNTVTITKGQEVYSKYYDNVNSNNLKKIITASDVHFENNISYTLACTVSMNSGLSATDTYKFRVAFADSNLAPNAKIGYDHNAYNVMLKPYCEHGKTGEAITDVVLSVYRREYDGSFTEIQSNINGKGNRWVMDPHPSLDYARYRIVATHNVTGDVDYYDLPAYPINEKSVIVQWNEEWSVFDTDDEAAFEDQPWSGSLLKLPYNIDVSNSNNRDVELVEYIGRKHPVTYYGTQLGETAVWNMVIPKSDKETLYGLRRLQNWMGDVYIREPSGSGYWANVNVSFDQKHRSLTIPVTLNITRVEGGA